MARPASDISARILHAARERFLLEGVDGASLRNIARDAGTNIGMVYYYYKTKDDLLLAVVDEVYEGMLADMRAIFAQPVSAEQRIAEVYQRFAAMSDDEDKVIRLILREALISSGRLTRLFQRFQTGHIPLVLELMQQGVASGQLRRDVHPVAQIAATFALGMLPQLIRRQLAATDLPIAQFLPTAPAVAHTMFTILRTGIAEPSREALGRPSRR